MIKVICINDKNRPVEIPTNHWIKLNEQYHITHIFKMINYGNVIGVTLKEIDLYSLKDCPYHQFRLDRFAIHQDDLEKFLKLAQDCSDLNDVDLAKLMKEVNELQFEPVLK